jgi:hypothetical protein
MALPPGWTRYTTDEGKEYFHNGSTNTVQWERPEWAGGLAPDKESFGASEVYQYKPEEQDLELQRRGADCAGSLEPTARLDVKASASSADDGAVSLHAAPGGRIGQGGDAGGSTSFRSNVGSLVGGAIAAATGEDNSGMGGIFGSMLTFAQQFFDVTSDDVLKRLRVALLPYPPPPRGTPNDFRDRPDFWGPFWVATTAVLCLAATGNLARLLALPSTDDQFQADYSLVSEASLMIYGLLIGVPLATRLALYITGQSVDTVNFKQMICVYGYSLAPTIPVSMLCLVPLEAVRWLVVLGGTGISMLFLREYILLDISVEAPSLKWKMVGLFFGSQLFIFLMYRVHFF